MAEDSALTNEFWDALGNLPSAHDVVAGSVADRGSGISDAQLGVDAHIVPSTGQARAGSSALDGGCGSAAAGGEPAPVWSTSASSHAAGRWQPPEVTLDGGRQTPHGPMFSNRLPFGCKIRLPRPTAELPGLPSSVRFGISLAILRPGVHLQASTAGPPAYTPLDQVPLPLPDPPLQLLRHGRRDDLVAPELDVPTDGELVTCQLQISHVITSSAYREHRRAGGLTWEAEGLGVRGVPTARGATVSPRSETALFCVRVEPADPLLAAEHPELCAITNPGFQVVTRLRSMAHKRPEATDESATSHFRSLSISASILPRKGPSLLLPTASCRVSEPTVLGPVPVAPRYRVLSGGRVWAVDACGLVRPGCLTYRPCSASSAFRAPYAGEGVSRRRAALSKTDDSLCELLSTESSRSTCQSAAIPDPASSLREPAAIAEATPQQRHRRRSSYWERSHWELSSSAAEAEASAASFNGVADGVAQTRAAAAIATAMATTMSEATAAAIEAAVSKAVANRAEPRGTIRSARMDLLLLGHAAGWSISSF